MEARPAPYAIIRGKSSRRAGRSGRARTTNANEKEDVNLALSHVNSAPRPSLDGKTPYDEEPSDEGNRDTGSART